jgi:hypothetical protein
MQGLQIILFFFLPKRGRKEGGRDSLEEGKEESWKEEGRKGGREERTLRVLLSSFESVSKLMELHTTKNAFFYMQL